MFVEMSELVLKWFKKKKTINNQIKYIYIKLYLFYDSYEICSTYTFLKYILVFKIDEMIVKLRKRILVFTC